MSTLLPNSIIGVDLVNDNAVYLQDSDTDYILSQIDDAIDLAASGTQLVIRGTVGSDLFSGINIGIGETNNSIMIATTGFVSGHLEGIDVNSDSNTVTNYGKIFGIDDGVDIQPSTTDNVLINFGEIVGQTSGVDTFLSVNAQIYNHGQIIGTNAAGVYLSGEAGLLHNTGDIASLGDAGITIETAIGQTGQVFNSGTISGSDFSGNAIVGGAGEDTVVNPGTINGNVSLGGGNDVFDGIGGKVFGSVHGGTGDDHYIVDDSTLTLIEALNGGIDTVTADAGWTLGANFENLNLVGDGHHSGIGNNLANVIDGNIGDNAIKGGGGNDVLRGGAGNDTLLGDAGNDRVVGGHGDDAASGGAGNDVVRGDDGDDILRGGSGDDRLSGGAGEDAITGGAGRDLLFGGADADRFVYNSIVETPVGAGRDRIKQFSSAQGDLIDLAGMDADIDSAGDDSFSFIGTSGFSGSAGELRYSVNNAGDAIVSGDITGDGDADFQIIINNTATLTASDFVL